MQNHMTELLLLSLLDLPTNISSSAAVCAAKAAVLRDLAGPGPSGLLLGQYAGYPGEWAEETRQLVPHRSESSSLHPSTETTTRTPTFAAVTLGVHSPRWLGVPLLIVSGKKMEVKASFVRVTFDRQDYRGGAEELLFFIGGTAAPDGLILCSHGLACAPTADLQKTDVPSAMAAFLTTMTHSYDAFRLRQTPSPPYSNLILDAIAGRREHFVSEQQLLSSWRLWSSVLRTADELPLNLYRSPSVLRFRRSKFRLQWVSIADVERHSTQSVPLDKPALLGAGPKPVVAAAVDIAAAVARRISRAAAEALERRKVFHLALPGGSSALALMAALRDLQPPLDWARVHVWLTDERCVGRQAAAANINTLDVHLLRHVAIPLTNVHAVQIASDARRSCVDGGAVANYQAELEALLGPEGRFDFVVLGVGSDGHTASLFPDDEQALKAAGLATLTAVHGVPPVQRVSLTFLSLRASREVAVLVVGEGKRTLARDLISNWNKLVVEGKAEQSSLFKPFVRVLQFPEATAFIERSLV